MACLGPPALEPRSIQLESSAPSNPPWLTLQTGAEVTNVGERFPCCHLSQSSRHSAAATSRTANTHLKFQRARQMLSPCVKGSL